eukprot:Phypoly_transcript_06927.p1 GENE.Phypoly_transcript_06927~~Phypoly_transcript_06927.p1  ORF type:complete len:407 (+),score=93.49 Phypoly_transcript_06927:434-1654(+)
MRKKGNANAKKYFEATMKPSDSWDTGSKRVVSENIAATSFLRRKYEYLEFTPKKGGLSNSGNTRAEAASPPLSPRFLPAYAYESPKSKRPPVQPEKPAPAPAPAAPVQQKPVDLLTDDFKPRGETTKSDIMQLFDPKLQPTKNVAPASPSYPTANYNVHINAPAPNPFLPNYTPVLSPNPFTAPPAPLSPFGNHNPAYVGPTPAFYSSPTPAPYPGPNPATYSNPTPASYLGPNPATYSSPNPLRPAGPDPTVPLPPRTNPFASLPTIPSPQLTSSYGTPLTSSTGAQPFSPTFGAPPLSPRLGAQPVTSSFGAQPLSPSFGNQPFAPSFGAQPLNSSYGAQPLSPFGANAPNPFTSPHFGTPQSPAGHQIGRPNYGTPMPSNYAQPPNPFLADDPNYIASQFNMR